MGFAALLFGDVLVALRIIGPSKLGTKTPLEKTAAFTRNHWRVQDPWGWRIIPFSKWIITMVIVSPLRIGLWDPFQMVLFWLINRGC